MTTIAIIPARGGSKRLPRKNIIPVQGKPALFYPVKAALASGIFDQVIVSTEDDEIRSVARKSGAMVIERSKKLAGDRIGVVDVCLDVLEKLDKEGVCPAFFCCIYATAVFIMPKDLQESFQLIKNSSSIDVMMGVSKYNLQPVQALEANKKGFLKPRWPEYYGMQSQFHPKLKASNGTFYWASTSSFLQGKTFYPDKLMGYEIPWIRAIDLDTPEDYKILQRLAPVIFGSKSQGEPPLEQ